MLDSPEGLIAVEKFVLEAVITELFSNFDDYEAGYDEANYLHPFWRNFPPDDRGRSPRGDQVPWIEVGEHAIGHKLNRKLGNEFAVNEIGLPSGADNRFVLSDPKISGLTGGLTDSVMVFLDIKSVGPRDNFDHTVLSPFQVSGDGLWQDINEGLTNTPVEAIGKRARHDFYPAVAPIYVSSDEKAYLTVHIFVKPVYRMLSEDPKPGMTQGQPLDEIVIVCVPNGLLLTGPKTGYLEKNPGLFYPGKDDKSKPPLKVRCRVDFALLRSIAEWRVVKISRADQGQVVAEPQIAAN